MFYPLNYDQINLIEGTYQPSTIKNRNNASFDFWVRSLFERAQSSIIFELPDYWQGDIMDFWYYCIYKWGYLSVQDLTKIDRDDAKAIGMCFNSKYDKEKSHQQIIYTCERGFRIRRGGLCLLG